jgi:6-pyruvoyl-tetrahydropterin synthase
MPKWKLTKTFNFGVNYRRVSNKHKTSRPNLTIAVVLESDCLTCKSSEQATVMSFRDITDRVRPLLEAMLDHYLMHDHVGPENPTIEILAQWVYEKLAPTIPCLSAIIVNDMLGASCEYRE